MKYAICYRGISYKENFSNYSQIPPYTVDFFNCSESNKQNLINPLIHDGHEVDIFFNTYDSDKLDQYIQELNPVSVFIRDFNPNIQKYNFPHVAKLIIDSLEQIVDYQEKNNVKYDYIILTRFDLFIFHNFIDIFIPDNSIAVPTVNDDCFIVIDGKILEQAISLYKENQFSCITHHMVYKFLESGIKYHIMFPHKPGTEELSNNYPFYRIDRLMFSPKGHVFKDYDLQDVFDKQSKYYGFLYPPNKEYVSGDNVIFN